MGSLLTSLCLAIDGSFCQFLAAVYVVTCLYRGVFKFAVRVLRNFHLGGDQRLEMILGHIRKFVTNVYCSSLLERQHVVVAESGEHLLCESIHLAGRYSGAGPGLLLFTVVWIWRCV